MQVEISYVNCNYSILINNFITKESKNVIMNTIKLISLLIFPSLLSVSLFGQNNATIEETVDFLNSKLSKQIGTRSITVSIDKSKCQLIIIDYNKDDSQITEKAYIPLNKIDPSRIEVFQPKGFERIKLDINILNDEKLIKYVQTYKSGVVKDTFYDHWHQFDFDMLALQNNIPERVKKAFIHAIKLCGGKQEKF